MNEPTPEKLPHTMWDLVEQMYKEYYPGLVVQGFMVIDVADGDGRALRFISSPDSTSWGIKGMIHEVSSQLDAEIVGEVLMGEYGEPEPIEEGDDDDE